MMKAEYILRILAKIRHKGWELFVISRILHKLEDDEIEFVTQQFVRGSNGERYLTDLFFPQFGIHLEIDERQHLDSSQADKLREQDIVRVTEQDMYRIQVFNEDRSAKSVSEIRVHTDHFVEKIRRLKLNNEKENNFVPWDLDAKYASATVISRGYLDITDNVTFRLQVEALRCFGFKGRGWQKGRWNIPDGTDDWVWFPRLYQNYIWNNEMSSDGAHIFQRAINDQSREYNATQNAEARLVKQGNVIVFAKAKDALGENVLRYVGTFRHNISASNSDAIQFDRVSTREKVRSTHF
jgi:hypothetical protein